MQKNIQSALISVFYKDGLEPIAKNLHELGITIYSTGGTQKFLEDLGIPCVAVESLTTYPSILGGRVKTLHPAVFGGILGRRSEAQDLQEMKEYKIPEIDLVIVDLYPFEETLRNTSEEKAIIEKIDIGGPSMIRAAAKNFRDLVVIAAKEDYTALEKLLVEQKGATTLEQRRAFAAKAFEVVMHYDIAISNYFNPGHTQSLRYGENPHQQAVFHGNLEPLFTQLNGKELSYNNLVDVDAAVQLIQEFSETTFAIIKHTNVCGIAARPTVKASWDAALAGDPESAFGGVLVCNGTIDKATAEAINEIFFEVLIAPTFDADALEILKSKKNRILLVLNAQRPALKTPAKSLLNGTLEQGADTGNYSKWEEVGGRETTASEKENLSFANLVCKHLKSNAIALVKDKQLVGKGCGQTSRIDALRHAIEKAKQFNFDLKGAVLASDAFFPFNDCVQIAHAAGIEAFIQPGGSVRDKDSIAYCVEHKLSMVMTGMRHFRH
ncbi:IMP cyclohydrolase /phosphoribosylaminoimidazolecarboxamide formyltransferase [Hydrobacter penzbergensis]|jgi:phosphoribosylaminoimidazolecarboxamide formyltransferase / IMP cyclohydrolase|uniref:Bifunctional purine biosynthesis protein PurH n=1 Tax=Hydrobacter penzbergensis TaxID=1235997 RepID=A0A8X8LEX6_9BACT|nr:bifunctional phosphoribosylaminoimidazolecarboxamide formyltransferase/IMP cyclohydrolase [Hydrobacter penzbergensis]SDX44365.1 IMP cyclohydrolase /phosphoribosylaminoimidazolecarboxamide formyltransferase [Hydrobacter penzbergensis]